MDVTGSASTALHTLFTMIKHLHVRLHRIHAIPLYLHCIVPPRPATGHVGANVHDPVASTAHSHLQVEAGHHVHFSLLDRVYPPRGCHSCIRRE